MILVLLSITIIYILTISWLFFGYSKIKDFESNDLTPKITFTIIVPFRNEAETLPILLESFSKLNYPNHLFSVLLVDDESEEVFSVPSKLLFDIEIIKNIRISNSPKKDAISTAMQIVNTDWVITTDADCVVAENWLLTMDSYIQNNNASMLAGAVTYKINNSFLQHFQQLDLASLQGATIGSFGLGKGFMCNGANFAYTKSLFLALNGFEGNDKIASGDDVFLLQKAIANSPEKVHYLKSENTIVVTKPVDDWKSLFYQRVRWASKTGSYQSSFGKFLGLVVFVENFCLALSFWFWVLDMIPFQNLVLLFLIKFSIDTILIFKTNTFLTKTKIRYLILSSIVYPFFSVTVALYSLFGKHEWKGRRF